MGFRAGLIGSSLLFSRSARCSWMSFWRVGLNRTSLAGFIIAMGMLVDNAIVVTDNAQQQAMLRARHAARPSSEPTPRGGACWGATLIAIFSFLPLYSPLVGGRDRRPLFVVLASAAAERAGP